MDKVPFKRVMPRGSVDPVPVADMTAAYQQDLDRTVADIERQGRRADANYRTAEENAKRYMQNVEPLAKFSESLAKALGNQYLRDEESKAIGRQYEALTGGGFNEGEEEAEIELEQAAEVAGPMVGQESAAVEDVLGDPVAGQEFRNSVGGLYQGYATQSTDLLQASTMVQPFMSSWMSGNAKIDVNGKAVTVQQLIGAGREDLAYQAGIREFISKNGLQYATKRAFVKAMKEPMMNAQTQILTGIATTRAKAEKDARQNQVLGTSASLASNGRLTPAAVDTLASNALTHGVYMNMSQATRAVLEDGLKAAAAKGDETTITRLEGHMQSNGLTYGTEYGDLFALYSEQAGDRSNALANRADTAATRDNRTVPWNTLSPEEREAQYERRLADARRNGHDGAVRDLETNRNGYLFPGNENTNTEVKVMIDSGIIENAQGLDPYRTMLTTEQLLQREQQLTTANNRKDIKDPITKKTVDAAVKGSVDRIGVALGLKKDPTGQFMDTPDANITKEQLTNIEAAIRSDLYEQTNIIANDPSLTPEQKKLEIGKAIQAWKDINLNNPSGTYYIQGIEDSRASDAPLTPRQQQAEATQIENLQRQAGDAINLSTFTQDERAPTARQKNLIPLYRKDPTLARQFYNAQRKDIVVDQAATLQAQAAYETTGVVPSEFEAIADNLQVPPLAFLQQQLRAHGLPLAQIQGPASSSPQQEESSSEPESSGENTSEMTGSEEQVRAALAVESVMGQVEVNRKTAIAYLAHYGSAEAAVQVLGQMSPNELARLNKASEKQLRRYVLNADQGTVSGMGGGEAAEGGS